jgi:hypothetical protein
MKITICLIKCNETLIWIHTESTSSITQNGTGGHFCRAKINASAIKDFSPPDVSLSSCTCVPSVSKETEIPIPLIVLISVTYGQ